MDKPVISAIAILLATPSVARSVAVTNVTAIDPASETVRRNVTVLIESGRIVRIDNRNRRVPPGVRQLDGRGKFLIPGLWDAHAHLSKTGRGSLNLYIANGITGVRDMGSNLEEVKGWRDAIAAGQLIGPRIKFSGPGGPHARAYAA